MTHPGRERRESYRATREIYASFVLKGRKKGEGLFFSRTLSPGGLSFLRRLPLPKGTALEMSLYLPNLLEPLKTAGDVVHSTPERDGQGFRIGVSFRTMGEIGRSEITQFIEGR